jgi:hypothetical protein
MPDELDAQLLRWFADGRQTLTDVRFTARVAARLPAVRSRGAPLRALGAALARGFAVGLRAPLHVRHAGVMTLAAAAFTLWAALQG